MCKIKNKKILITGVSGFVGFHLLSFLCQYAENIEVCGVDIKIPSFDCKEFVDILSLQCSQVDLLNLDELEKVFEKFVPDYIVHLASFSSVAYSWKNPMESFTNNTNIFLNLITVAMKYNQRCRVLSVGSSEEYGIVSKEKLPLRESVDLNPISPYAVARVSQEMLSRVFAQNYNMDIVLTRSFNHIGPYQDKRFVIPSIIERMLKIKRAGYKKGIIQVGDLSIVRDFVDVRDVVRAYCQLLVGGKTGEIYNICTGKGISLKEITHLIAQELDLEIETEVNTELLRPNDNPIIIGSAEKIRKEIGWKPEFELRQTLNAMIIIQSEMQNIAGRSHDEG